MEKIKINLGPYFPFNLRIFGIILISAAFLQFIPFGVRLITVLISMGLCYIGLSIFISSKRIIIDLQKNEIHDFAKFGSFNIGNHLPFGEIILIYVNKVNTNQNFQSRGRSLQIKNVIYKAFIMLDTEKTVMIDEDKNKQRLIDRVSEYNKTLQVEYRDNT